MALKFKSQSHSHTQSHNRPIAVNGPMCFIHMMHPKTRKEIILCGDFHGSYSPCPASTKHQKHQSFLTWVTSVAQQLPARYKLDLFVEAPPANARNPPKVFSKRYHDQGFLFGETIPKLEAISCLAGESLACKKSLASLGVHNLRVHAIDPRREMAGLMSLIKLLRYAEQSDDANVWTTLKKQVLLFRDQLGDPAQRPHFEPKTLLYKAHLSTSKAENTKLIDMCLNLIIAVFLAHIAQPRDRFLALMNQTPDVLELRAVPHNEFVEDLVEPAIQKLAHELEKLNVADPHEDRSAALYAIAHVYQVCLSYTTPILDIYAVSRFLKRYITHCIVYVGWAHAMHMALVLKAVFGFDIINQNPSMLQSRLPNAELSPECLIRQVFVRFAQQLRLDVPIYKPNAKTFIVAWQVVYWKAHHQAHHIPQKRSHKVQEVHDSNYQYGLLVKYHDGFYEVLTRGNTSTPFSQCLIPVHMQSQRKTKNTRRTTKAFDKLLRTPVTKAVE